MTILPDLPLIAIYADESCLGNGREGENPGGAGGVIEYMNRAGLSRHDFWSSSPATTNNRMALQSVIDAFTLIARKGKRFRVCFTSDSQYLVKGMSDWVFGWMAKGWRKKDGEILNLELWQQAVEAKRAGAEMTYVAMFDEVDEGTAIFKASNQPPVGESEFMTYEGLPPDHYLWLTGEIGKMLRRSGGTDFSLPKR